MREMLFSFLSPRFLSFFLFRMSDRDGVASGYILLSFLASLVASYSGVTRLFGCHLHIVGRCSLFVEPRSGAPLRFGEPSLFLRFGWNSFGCYLHIVGRSSLFGDPV